MKVKRYLRSHKRKYTALSFSQCHSTRINAAKKQHAKKQNALYKSLISAIVYILLYFLFICFSCFFFFFYTFLLASSSSKTMKVFRNFSTSLLNLMYKRLNVKIFLRGDIPMSTLSFAVGYKVHFIIFILGYLMPILLAIRIL